MSSCNFANTKEQQSMEPRYSSKVLMGNWSEDLAMQEVGSLSWAEYLAIKHLFIIAANNINTIVDFCMFKSFYCVA